MLRYLRPDLLAAAGVEAFDAWAATFGRQVEGHVFTDRPQAASAVRDALLAGYHLPGVPIKIDAILGGHTFAFTPRADRATVDIEIKGAPRSTFPAVLDAFRQGTGGIQRLENRVAKLPELLTELRHGREASKAELEAIAAQIDKPFPHADQLHQARRESEALQARMDERAAQAATVTVHHLTELEANRHANSPALWRELHRVITWISAATTHDTNPFATKSVHYRRTFLNTKPSVDL